MLVLLFGSVAIGAMMPSKLTVSKGGSKTQTVETRSGFFDRSNSNETQVDLGTGTITLDRNSDGHFYADAQINGTSIHFLVDTGATGIALTHDDAQRAGVPMSGSSMPIGMGAGGALTGEIVALDRVSLGPKEVRDMRAAVIDGGDISLLGQSFLSQFASVSIENDKMMLR